MQAPSAASTIGPEGKEFDVSGTMDSYVSLIIECAEEVKEMARVTWLTTATTSRRFCWRLRIFSGLFEATRRTCLCSDQARRSTGHCAFRRASARVGGNGRPHEEE